MGGYDRNVYIVLSNLKAGETQISYKYDQNGYQIEKTEVKGTTKFEYDELGRIKN